MSSLEKERDAVSGCGDKLLVNGETMHLKGKFLERLKLDDVIRHILGSLRMPIDFSVLMQKCQVSHYKGISYEKTSVEKPLDGGGYVMRKDSLRRRICRRRIVRKNTKGYQGLGVKRLFGHGWSIKVENGW